jgi:hypothetical protein
MRSTWTDERSFIGSGADSDRRSRVLCGGLRKISGLVEPEKPEVGGDQGAELSVRRRGRGTRAPGSVTSLAKGGGVEGNSRERKKGVTPPRMLDDGEPSSEPGMDSFRLKGAECGAAVGTVGGIDESQEAPDEVLCRFLRKRVEREISAILESDKDRSLDGGFVSRPTSSGPRSRMEPPLRARLTKLTKPPLRVVDPAREGRLDVGSNDIAVPGRDEVSIRDELEESVYLSGDGTYR